MCDRIHFTLNVHFRVNANGKTCLVSFYLFNYTVVEQVSEQVKLKESKCSIKMYNEVKNTQNQSILTTGLTEND